MEIDKLRQELNDLLENIVEHSENYSKNRPIPSLEVSYVLSKVSKMQETLIVLKHLLKEEEINAKKRRAEEKAAQKPAPAPAPEEVVVVPEPEEDQIKQEVEASLGVEAPAEEPAFQSEEQATSKPNIEKMPIAKLADALTLNDRYLYANELFGKDMNAFNECVKAIDACSSHEEANSTVASVSSERSWDQENVHVESFHALVERRFL